MSAQAIGSLFVSLGLDSAAFTSGIKDVQGRMQGLAKTLGKAAAGIVATAAPAMIAMGVSAMNAATEIDRAAKLANAAPAEFQGWAAGAASVGIEQDKLGDILKDVNDRVGDFIATGGGPMADFFERVAPKVGVTADQFRKLSGPQALQLYVSSLEKANLNQQDMTFFMEAMASESTALLPLLRGNGAAMAEMAAKAQALGAVMDDETVASFAKAKQTMSEVQLAFTGFRNILAAQVVPALAGIARAFVTASQAGHWLGDAVRTLADLIPRLMTYAASFAALMAGKWVAAFVAARLATLTLAGALGVLRVALLKTGLGAIVVVVGELVYQIGRWIGSVGGMAAAFYTLKSKFLRVLAGMVAAWSDFTWSVAEGFNALFGTDFQGAALGHLQQELIGSAREAEGMAAAAKKAGAAAAAAATGVSGLGSGLSSAADGAGSAKAQISDLERVMKSLRDEADKLRATMGMSELQAEIWDKQREAGVGAQSVQGKQISGLVTQIDRMKQLKDATEEWRQSISSAFSNFITQGGSFKNVLSQIIGKLAEMLAQQAFTGLIGAGTKGGGFLGSTLKFLGFANGTLSAPGGLARVHERGGEIMNLPRGTQVIPHDISKRMADRSAQGGLTAVQISLAPDLIGQILQQAGSQSVQIVQANNRALPDRIAQINSNPRMR